MLGEKTLGCERREISSNWARLRGAVQGQTSHPLLKDRIAGILVLMAACIQLCLTGWVLPGVIQDWASYPLL